MVRCVDGAAGGADVGGGSVGADVARVGPVAGSAVGRGGVCGSDSVRLDDAVVRDRLSAGGMPFEGDESAVRPGRFVAARSGRVVVGFGVVVLPRGSAGFPEGVVSGRVGFGDWVDCAGRWVPLCGVGCADCAGVAEGSVGVVERGESAGWAGAANDVGGGAVAVAADAAVVEEFAGSCGLVCGSDWSPEVGPECWAGGGVVLGAADWGGALDMPGDDGRPEVGALLLWPVDVLFWAGESPLPGELSCGGRSSGAVVEPTGLSLWAGRSSDGSWLGGADCGSSWAGRSSGLVPGGPAAGCCSGRSSEFGGCESAPAVSS